MLIQTLLIIRRLKSTRCLVPIRHLISIHHSIPIRHLAQIPRVIQILHLTPTNLQTTIQYIITGLPSQADKIDKKTRSNAFKSAHLRVLTASKAHILTLS